MKKNILIIGLASIFGIASGLISCSPDYETEFKVETLVVPDKSQAPITFPLLGGEHEIEVQTNVPLDRWSAQSNAEWCKVVQHEGKVVVSASANNIYKQRRAEITVAYGHQSYSITVSQFGKEPAILIGDKLQQEGYVEIIDAERETLTIPVATNLNLDNIIIPDTCNWIRLAEQPATFDAKTRAAEDVNKQELKFTLDKSTETDVRYCTIILQSSQNYSYTASFLKMCIRDSIKTLRTAKENMKYTQNNNRYRKYYMEAKANWDRTFGLHSLGALALYLSLIHI